MCQFRLFIYTHLVWFVSAFLLIHLSKQKHIFYSLIFKRFPLSDNLLLCMRVWAKNDIIKVSNTNRDRYSLLAIQPNKGLAGFCKNYQHFCSCVRTKSVYKSSTKLDFVFSNLNICCIKSFVLFLCTFFVQSIAHLRRIFNHNRTQHGILVLFYIDKKKK